MGKRLTKEVVNKRLEPRGLSLVGDYVGSKWKAEFQCSKGHIWRTTPNTVLCGNGCPKCAGNAPISERLLKERLKGMGIAHIGTLLNSSSKTTFLCDKEHTWEAAPSAVVRGKGCPHCYREGHYLTAEIVNLRLADRGVKLVGDYSNNLSKADFLCKQGHTWSTSTGAVLGGSGCPYCWRESCRIDRETLENRLAPSGIKLLGEYISQKKKTTFVCGEGHTWETLPSSIFKGKGCPECSITGFKKSSPATFYIQKLVGAEESFLKFGITNNDPYTRMRKQSSTSIFSHSLLHTVYSDNGADIYAMERSVKDNIERFAVGKEDLKDGYTETCRVSQLSRILDIINETINKGAINASFTTHNND